MSADEDAFLARWSRRKIEARRSADAEPESTPVEEQQEAAPTPEPAIEAELTPEEIEALPKLDELTPESDLTAFLKKGVPEALRNAALRRMWSVDPAVRDYVGDARDYAWDWNVPGGVPGNGPLTPTLQIPEDVKRLFSDHTGDPRQQETAAAQGADDAEPGSTEPASAEPAGAPQLASSSVRLGGPPAPEGEQRAEPPAAELPAGSPVRVPSRRHGGAVPG